MINASDNAKTVPTKHPCGFWIDSFLNEQCSSAPVPPDVTQVLKRNVTGVRVFFRKSEAARLMPLIEGRIRLVGRSLPDDQGSGLVSPMSSTRNITIIPASSWITLWQCIG